MPADSTASSQLICVLSFRRICLRYSVRIFEKIGSSSHLCPVWDASLVVNYLNSGVENRILWKIEIKWKDVWIFQMLFEIRVVIWSNSLRNINLYEMNSKSIQKVKSHSFFSIINFVKNKCSISSKSQGNQYSKLILIF